MDRDAALRVAGHDFPAGPEKVAELLGAVVEFHPINADGWCLPASGGQPPLVTLNSKAPKGRQRFTLAHELAHLILGTEPEVITRSGRDLYNPRSADEVAANQLASELLLPLDRVKGLLRLPLDARALANLAHDCQVSEVALGLRLARNAGHFELPGATLVKLGDGVVEWAVPPTRTLSDSAASALYGKCIRAGRTLRLVPVTGRPALVVALASRTYPAFFYYRLTGEYATRETPAEARRRVEAALFGEFAEMRNSLNGKLSAYKSRSPELGLRESLADFHSRHGPALAAAAPALYRSPVFAEYLSLRLAEWAKPDS